MQIKLHLEPRGVGWVGGGGGVVVGKGIQEEGDICMCAHLLSRV